MKGIPNDPDAVWDTVNHTQMSPLLTAFKATLYCLCRHHPLQERLLISEPKINDTENKMTTDTLTKTADQSFQEGQALLQANSFLSKSILFSRRSVASRETV
jgi:hypothetical protein